MRPIIDLQLLGQTRFDSAAPTGTAVVVHQFEQDGVYEVDVGRRDEVVERLPLVVGGEGGGRPEGLPAQPAPEGQRGPARPALALDVTAVLRPGVRPPELSPLPSSGYLSITSPRPGPDHHVVVRRRGAPGEPSEGQEVLDTRRLGPRSVFAVTLVRPGRYALRNAISGAQAEVVVAYPQVGETPYRPPAPLEIEVTQDGFGAPSFPLSPAQGIVFRLRTESRIELELVEPDDGPAPERGPRARRVRPRDGRRT